jgi:hypothetical protein
MPLAIGYVLRGKCDFTGENVLIAAAPPNFVCAPAPGELLAEIAKRGERHSGPRRSQAHRAQRLGRAARFPAFCFGSGGEATKRMDLARSTGWTIYLGSTIVISQRGLRR